MPIYANRVVLSEFLRKLVFVPNHSNILEDFLWHTLGSVEMVALLRVHVLYDLLISHPLRWLSGRSSELSDWSIYSMAGVLDLVEGALVNIAANGHALLDPGLDIFKPIAEKQQLFAEWRAANAQETVTAADGTTKHARWKVLSEAQSPQNADNQRATELTVELA